MKGIKNQTYRWGHQGADPYFGAFIAAMGMYYNAMKGGDKLGSGCGGGRPVILECGGGIGSSGGYKTRSLKDLIDNYKFKRKSKLLRNKMKRIRNQTAAGGNRGVTGSVSNADALRLGKEFVGPGYKAMSNGKGYVSADGLRTFRFPTNKRGVNPSTGEPWSKTGRQVNFETKAVRGERPISNVHLDVK